VSDKDLGIRSRLCSHCRVSPVETAPIEPSTLTQPPRLTTARSSDLCIKEFPSKGWTLFSSHETPFFNISNMPSSSSSEISPTQSQPCADAVATASAQVAIPSIRQSSRAYPKNTIVRSRNSHATLAKPRRRHRAYPTEAAYQNRPPILSTSKTRDPTPKPSRGLQELTRKPTVSERIKNSICETHEEACLGNSCFLCLRSGTHRYAVVVNFAWPGIPIDGIKIKKTKKLDKDTVQVSFEDITFKKQGTQAQVMQAIQDAIYQQSGTWKRWLWCYEILTAEEVKVSLISGNK
jgi:hypothetical protein